MRIRKLLGFGAAALAALGILGGITYQFFWDPNETFEAAPNESASSVTDEQLTALAESRVFFAHMSVGKNIISGLDQLYAAHDMASPTVLDIEPGQAPDVGDGGVIVSSLIGENRHPYRKLENFESTLRAGLSSDVDVALIKFCYIDVRWDTDVDRLFSTYRATLDELQRDFPDVRFIHVTTPLTTGAYGLKDHIKLLVGRDDNGSRERYNEMLRTTYGEDQVLDVATLEGTAPDGTFRAELYRGYSSDGAHLNATGQGLAAAEFVRMLAAQAGES